jgi:uncharacterized protein YndB with AHSA1/START domain
MANNIYHNLVIDAPPKKVFDGVTMPEHLVNWWPLKCSGKPVLGAEYNLNFTDKYDWYGTVSLVEPNKSFHIKMTKSDTDWDPTTFGFDLEDLGDKTRIKFSHRDWPAINDHFKYSSFCWALLLNGLKAYLEKNEIIPFEERS